MLHWKPGKELNKEVRDSIIDQDIGMSSLVHRCFDKYHFEYNVGRLWKITFSYFVLEVLVLERPFETNVFPYQVSMKDGGLRIVLGEMKNLLNYAMETYAHRPWSDKNMS